MSDQGKIYRYKQYCCKESFFTRIFTGIIENVRYRKQLALLEFVIIGFDREILVYIVALLSFGVYLSGVYLAPSQTVIFTFLANAFPVHATVSSRRSL